MVELSHIKLQLTKKKIFHFTVNPKTTSFLSFKEMIQKLHSSLDFSNDILYISPTIHEWVPIKTEFEWQEAVQFYSNSTVLLKFSNQNQIMKIQEKFSNFQTGKGIGGMIKRYEHDLKIASYTKNLEKIHDLGFQNQMCFYLLVKHKNDFNKVKEVLQKEKEPVKKKNFLSPKRVNVLDNYWIKEEKEPIQKIKLDLDGIVKEKIEKYQQEENNIFFKGIGNKISETQGEKLNQLVKLGYEEDVAGFFLAKSGYDVKQALLELHKTRWNFMPY